MIGVAGRGGRGAGALVVGAFKVPRNPSESLEKAANTRHWYYDFLPFY